LHRKRITGLLTTVIIQIRTIWGQTLKMNQILEGVKNKGNNPQIPQIPYVYHLVICEIFEICG